MARRSPVPPACVPCDGCTANRLMESEAAVSRRAYAGAVLCWRCRLRHGARATVHQLPAGCSAEVNGTGFGLWCATLRTGDGRAFTGGGLSDAIAVSRAAAAARAAGAL